MTKLVINKSHSPFDVDGSKEEQRASQDYAECYPDSYYNQYACTHGHILYNQYACTHNLQSVCLNTWTYNLQSVCLNTWTYNLQSVCLNTRTHNLQSICLHTCTYNLQSVCLHTWTHNLQSVCLHTPYLQLFHACPQYRHLFIICVSLCCHWYPLCTICMLACIQGHIIHNQLGCEHIIYGELQMHVNVDKVFTYTRVSYTRTRDHNGHVIHYPWSLFMP